jgi:hypothetical protein
LLGMSSSAFALHPLITDDTDTQGKGKFEVELGYQHDHNAFIDYNLDINGLFNEYLTYGNSVSGRVYSRSDVNQAMVTVSYGIIDNLDVVIGTPYKYIRTREKRTFYYGPFSGLFYRSIDTENGLSDMITEFKWKFFEYKLLSMAIKPGIIFPIGNAENGLGAGRFGGYGYFISTLDLGRVAMHLNLGYIRNENNINERQDIWHVSLALELWLVKDYLRLVVNSGFERSRNKSTEIQDAFILAGLVVSPTENCDIDVGYKHALAPKGIQPPGIDYSILGGITIRFGTVISDGKKKDEKIEGGK